MRREYSRLMNLIVAGVNLGLNPVEIMNRLSQDSLTRNKMKKELGVNGGQLDVMLRKASYDLFFMSLTPKLASRHYISLAKRIFSNHLGGGGNG